MYWLTTQFASFPFTSPPVRHRMPSLFKWSLPRFLQVGLLSRPITHKCLFKVLCPVSRPITTLDWILLKNNNLDLLASLGPEINSPACLCAIQMTTYCGLRHYCQLLRSDHNTLIPYRDQMDSNFGLDSGGSSFKTRTRSLLFLLTIIVIFLRPEMCIPR